MPQGDGVVMLSSYLLFPAIELFVVAVILPDVQPAELFLVDVLQGSGVAVLCFYLVESRWSCLLLVYYMVVVWSC